MIKIVENPAKFQLRKALRPAVPQVATLDQVPERMRKDLIVLN